MKRVYLDYNATAPLRPEARAAMIEAMDVIGNPSSVHAEGRAAKMLIERARAQVAELVGCARSEVIFNSGATESIGEFARYEGEIVASPIEHDAVYRICEEKGGALIPVDQNGHIRLSDLEDRKFEYCQELALFVQCANSETGILQPDALFDELERLAANPANVFRDATQVVGRISQIGRWPNTPPALNASLCLSAHKLGGPKGVGALIAGPDYSPGPFEFQFPGSQEMGRRGGTENVIGIAGFGAAAAAAKRDLDNGEWDRVEKLRNILEKGVAEISFQTIFIGKEVRRLPNTSCMLTPGWKGETQVMQMDLAGFAISAGSACSSGKVKASRVLGAMGYSEEEASCAVRVSLGLETTEEEITRFIDVWGEKYRKHKARAA